MFYVEYCSNPCNRCQWKADWSFKETHTSTWSNILNRLEPKDKLFWRASIFHVWEVWLKKCHDDHCHCRPKKVDITLRFFFSPWNLKTFEKQPECTNGFTTAQLAEWYCVSLISRYETQTSMCPIRVLFLKAWVVHACWSRYLWFYWRILVSYYKNSHLRDFSMRKYELKNLVQEAQIHTNYKSRLISSHVEKITTVTAQAGRTCIQVSMRGAELILRSPTSKSRWKGESRAVLLVVDDKDRVIATY